MNTDILSHEVSLYERRRREFEEKHRGQWVVIHQDDIGFYDDFQVAAQTAVDRFGRGPYLIRQVGAPVQPLPVSILYRVINDGGRPGERSEDGAFLQAQE